QDPAAADGPARRQLDVNSLRCRVRLRMTFEREVVHDRQRATGPSERNRMPGHEQQIRPYARERDRQPHLRPQPPEWKHSDVDAEIRLRLRGEEPKRQVGRRARQPRAELSRVALGSGDDLPSRGVDINRDDLAHDRLQRTDVTGVDLKLGAVVAALGSSDTQVAFHTVDHANLARIATPTVTKTIEVRTAS